MVNRPLKWCTQNGVKALSFLVVFVVAVNAGVVRAEPAAQTAENAPTSTRGFLSGLGVGLLGLGVAGLALGLSGVLISSDASKTLAVYGTPTQSEAATAIDLNGRLQTGNTLSLIGFIVGGALIAAGIALLVADAPRPVSFSIMPTPSGGLVQARFEF